MDMEMEMEMEMGGGGGPSDPTSAGRAQPVPSH